jgi:predicted O-methyltransferase YrrM
VGTAEEEAAFARIVEGVAGTPVMNPAQGRRIWDHFVRERPTVAVDIGTCYGTSAAYMAGAMKYVGRGRVVTVDSSQHDDASPAKQWCIDLWDRCGVSDVIEMVRTPHSSYAWWALDEVSRAADPDGNVTPVWDFVYLDGAKTLTIDLATVVLVERVLRPGGWLLLDDLPWTFDSAPEFIPTTVLANGERFTMSADEIAQPHLQAIFDHVIRPHPNLGHFSVQDDGWWMWCQKMHQPDKTILVERNAEPLGSVPGRVLLAAAARRAMARIRTSPRFGAGRGP